MTKSKFAPATLPTIHNVPGVRQATATCGIKGTEKPDLLLTAFAQGTRVAGVFTKSTTAAAPVDWCRRIIQRGSARGLVVNSGNANAFTGVAGLQVVEQEAIAAASVLDCDVDDIYIASTGVIGEQLPAAQIIAKIPTLAAKLSDGDWTQATRSIMTTDTFVKLDSCQTKIGSNTVTITGYAKGAGMIMPNMATMLCFIYTDANVSINVLNKLLIESMTHSFHAITVDGDTSTNDTVLAFATAVAQHEEITDFDDDQLADFKSAFSECLKNLAIQVVSDAEGITKLVNINVRGTKSVNDARTIAMSIANSPLVKTAFAGEDANWGRIVMAVGKAGVEIDKTKVGVSFGRHVLAINGNPLPLPAVEEVDEYMKQDRIEVNVTVGDGPGEMSVWTSDLSHEYVSINADYRT